MADNLKEKLAYQKHNPTLADLNRYFDDAGFVGDEETRLGLSVALMRRKCIGIVSTSGSGKSAVVDAFMTLVKPGQIYTMEAGSDKAEAYRADEINAASIVYLTEIQKAGQSEIVTELLKNLGEGKSYKRSVVKPGGGVDIQEIKAGKAVLYTKAIENKYETDDELDRRYPKFTTNISRAQNTAVVEAKARKRSNPNRPSKLNEEEADALRYHISQSLREDANKYIYINPMSEWLAKYIPTTFSVSRSYADHLFDYIEGVAFFNRRNRIIADVKVKGQDKKAILVSPEDCWQLHRIYNKQFLQDVLNIPPNGIHILEVFKEAKKKGVKSNVKQGAFSTAPADDKTRLTMDQIFLLLKEKGLVMKENVIQKILIDLTMSGYIREDVTQMGMKRVVEYYVSEALEEFQEKIDWATGINEAQKNIKENFPKLMEVFEKEYCLNPVFVDPFTGDKVRVAPEKLKHDNRDTWNT